MLFDGKRTKVDSNALWTGDCFNKIGGMLSAMLEKRPGRVLDYGCGKANYMDKLVANGVRHTGWLLYDPGYDLYSARPTMLSDYVVCTDVMEHVLDVDATLRDIAALCKPGATLIFTISGRKDRRAFVEDGQNMHITVKPLLYWVEKLEDHFPTNHVYMIYNNDQLWDSDRPDEVTTRVRQA